MSHIGPTDALKPHGYVATNKIILVSLEPWDGPFDIPGVDEEAFAETLAGQPGVFFRRIDLQVVLNGSVLLLLGPGDLRWVGADEVPETALLAAVQKARLTWPEWDTACEAAGVVRLPPQKWD